jgi:polar amino acid transport system substrate-binding protein
VLQLTYGRVDLIPSYRHVALNTARALGVAAEIKELAPSVEAIPAYLAFRKKRSNAKELAAFGQSLRAMKKDGSYDAIFQKYLGTH